MLRKQKKTKEEQPKPAQANNSKLLDLEYDNVELNKPEIKIEDLEQNKPEMKNEPLESKPKSIGSHPNPLENQPKSMGPSKSIGKPHKSDGKPTQIHWTTI